jgi:hypothetical protein
MFTAHTMFRREFGPMPGLVQAVTTGDTQRAALVADHIALVSDVLSEHHTGEDKYIWPHLWERCPDQCAPLIDVMEDQHHAIHAALLQVIGAAQAWRGTPSADARDALACALGRILPVMTEHLALEEERIVPLIEKYITQAEYAHVAQGQAAHIPPDKLPAVFGMIMYEADPAVIDMIVAELPAEIQPVIRPLATTAYAAYASELYGTATPPRVTATPVR